MNEPLEIVDYDPEWPHRFERLRGELAAALGDVAVRIEHVGSTAVPALAAKPKIDVDVVVRYVSDLETALERLAGIGYEHLGDLGVPGREVVRGPDGGRLHHVYVCAEGAEALRQHLAFRDYLRKNDDAAAEYALLKRRLAARFRHDREAYTLAKTPFVQRILARATAGDADAPRAPRSAARGADKSR